jgi:hypothetical protein
MMLELMGWNFNFGFVDYGEYVFHFIQLNMLTPHSDINEAIFGGSRHAHSQEPMT